MIIDETLHALEAFRRLRQRTSPGALGPCYRAAPGSGAVLVDRVELVCQGKLLPDRGRGIVLSTLKHWASSSGAYPKLRYSSRGGAELVMHGLS